MSLEETKEENKIHKNSSDTMLLIEKYHSLALKLWNFGNYAKANVNGFFMSHLLQKMTCSSILFFNSLQHYSSDFEFTDIQIESLNKYNHFFEQKLDNITQSGVVTKDDYVETFLKLINLYEVFSIIEYEKTRPVPNIFYIQTADELEKQYIEKCNFIFTTINRLNLSDERWKNIKIKDIDQTLYVNYIQTK